MRGLLFPFYDFGDFSLFLRDKIWAMLAASHPFKFSLLPSRRRSLGLVAIQSSNFELLRLVSECAAGKRWRTTLVAGAGAVLSRFFSGLPSHNQNSASAFLSGESLVIFGC